jgi:hypothetical protein
MPLKKKLNDARDEVLILILLLSLGIRPPASIERKVIRLPGSPESLSPFAPATRAIASRAGNKVPGIPARTSKETSYSSIMIRFH